MRMLKISKDGMLVIPKAFKAILKPDDKLAWFMDGDTLIIKKINPPKLSGIADRVKGKPMPLKKIAEEVREYRKNK